MSASEVSVNSHVLSVGRDEWVLTVIEQFWNNFQAEWPEGLPAEWGDRTVNHVADRAAFVVLTELEQVQIGRCQSSAELVKQFKISRQALSSRVARGALFALKDRAGAFSFPQFQFDENGQPLDELPRLIAALRAKLANDREVALWLTSPLRAGLSAVQLMKSGEPVSPDEEPMGNAESYLRNRRIITQIIRALVRPKNGQLAPEEG